MRAATSILCAWRWVDRRPTSYGSITHPEVSHKVLLFIGLKAVFYEDPLFACIGEAKLMNSEILLTCKLVVSVCSPWWKWWPFRLLGATGAAWICESAREDKIRCWCKIAWRRHRWFLARYLLPICLLWKWWCFSDSRQDKATYLPK